MSWDERLGTVTRAFDEWKSTDRDIRAYLDLSQRWGDAAYRRTWDEAQEEFSRSFNPDTDDVDGHVDLFHEMVGGLWAKDFYWMVRAAALRDAVSAFEVYLEKSLTELLARYYVADKEGVAYKLAPDVRGQHLSPSWPVLRKIHASLGNEIETDSVRYVLSLRHVLTHQRGELRTQEQRERYLAEESQEDWEIGEAYVGGDIPLGGNRVLAMMDDLSAVVRSVDPVIWVHTWGGGGFPEALRTLARKRGPLTWVPGATQTPG